MELPNNQYDCDALIKSIRAKLKKIDVRQTCLFDDEYSTYIVNLKERLHNLKQRKKELWKQSN